MMPSAENATLRRLWLGDVPALEALEAAILVDCYGITALRALISGLCWGLEFRLLLLPDHRMCLTPPEHLDKMGNHEGEPHECHEKGEDKPQPHHYVVAVDGPDVRECN